MATTTLTTTEYEAPYSPLPSVTLAAAAPTSSTNASRPKITIREATLADISQTSAIACRAFWSDDIFKMMYPPHLIAKFPNSPYEHTVRRHRKRVLSPSRVFLVATVPTPPAPTDPFPKPTIVGCACWERRTANPPPPAVAQWLANRNPPLSRLERLFVAIEDKIADVLSPPSRTMNMSAVNRYFTSLEEVDKEVYADPRYHERWELEMLAVDPAFQRKGIGRSLLMWGVRRADEEGVCCTLEASDRGLPLYESVGFELAQTAILEAEGSEVKLEVRHMKREPREREVDSW
ncbi:acyl-CoA N-acyltransferase [Kalaharituber pfeilii]|nr:acyl-CoA N-acyltransferase [Kalaharituber pfeilii]